MDDTNKLVQILKELEKNQIYIENKIDTMQQPYKTILYSIYIRGKTLVTVADEMNYNYTWMCEIHKKALKEYANTITE